MRGKETQEGEGGKLVTGMAEAHQNAGRLDVTSAEDDSRPSNSINMWMKQKTRNLIKGFC